ncbi:MAG: glycosyltransferase family 4 protein [Candidatus Aenigmatarchaeota archaeon]|nr:MAG: glycosyltransferase family 4 protein [Candidatus Aenigmarchaeota archaeon]
MNLGVFLYRGGSFRELKREGHDNLLVYYLKRYSKHFDNIFVFSYKDEERGDLPKNCVLVKNRYRIPLFLYQFLIPIINRKYIGKCGVFRVFHISGTIPAIITKWVFGKKYVTTYGYLWLQTRSGEKPGFWRKIEYPFGKIIEFLGLRKSEKVILTVKTTRDYVEKYIDRNKIEKIPNSVDTELFKPMKIKSGEKKRVVFIGRFSKIKNLYNLIEAFSDIGSGAELVFVGYGEEKEALKGHAKKMGTDLIFRGVIPREQIPTELNQSNVFILPSFSEGQPKVLLEAMSCGLPCIVSDIPSLREIIKDGFNGFLCKTDSKSIKNCIKRVLDNPKNSEKVGKNARKFIKNNFSADVLIEREIKLLKKVGKR